MVGGCRSGHSLIEALIALVLFASGVLVVAAAATHATATLRRAESRDEAHATLVSLADSLTQWASPTSGAATRGPYSVSWSVADSGAVASLTIRVFWSDGTARRSDSLQAFTATRPQRLHVVP